MYIFHRWPISIWQILIAKSKPTFFWVHHFIGTPVIWKHFNASSKSHVLWGLLKSTPQDWIKGTPQEWPKSLWKHQRKNQRLNGGEPPSTLWGSDLRFFNVSQYRTVQFWHGFLPFGMLEVYPTKNCWTGNHLPEDGSALSEWSVSTLSTYHCRRWQLPDLTLHMMCSR